MQPNSGRSEFPIPLALKASPKEQLGRLVIEISLPKILSFVEVKGGPAAEVAGAESEEDSTEGKTGSAVTIDQINQFVEEVVVLVFEFKRDLNACLAMRTGVPIRTLVDAIRFNLEHARLIGNRHCRSTAVRWDAVEAARACRAEGAR